MSKLSNKEKLEALESFLKHASNYFNSESERLINIDDMRYESEWLANKASVYSDVLDYLNDLRML